MLIPREGRAADLQEAVERLHVGVQVVLELRAEFVASSLWVLRRSLRVRKEPVVCDVQVLALLARSAARRNAIVATELRHGGEQRCLSCRCGLELQTRAA